LLLLRRGLAACAFAAERWPAALDLFRLRYVDFTLEREAERIEQCLALLVGGSSGDDGDVHATRCIDLVVVDLREHDLLGEAERVVATTVPAGGRKAAEVTNTRDGHADQPIEELPHAVAAQRDLAADRLPFTKLEACDRGTCLRDDRLLSGDASEVLDSALEQRRLLSC